MKNKKIILTIVLAFVALSTMSTLSNAALQSNFNTSRKSDTATNWVINVRNMESKNGGMGLNEVIDNTTGLPTTASNGIDVHLQKNTEYGAAILLGASDYGKQGAVGGTSSTRYMNSGNATLTGTDVKASSTGNVTGVYDLGSNWEWTAAGLKMNIFSDIATRYVDNYDDGNEKAGDATKATQQWHGSRGAYWVNSSNPGFVRSNDGVFSFNNYSASYGHYARACVVSAPGL